MTVPPDSASNSVAWHRANDYADILARLQPLHALPDGTVHIEPVGIHFHVVTKEGSALRFWLIDQTSPSTGVIQSEIHLDEPLMLQETYTQAMLLSLLWQPNPQAVYMAGLGGGRLAMVLGHFYPEVRIECAELEPQIITLAEKFFGIRRSAHLHVTVEDARVLLAQSDNLYDLILVDVFLDNGYSPYRLATVEFYELCRMRLSAGGALAVNLLANDPFVDRKLESICSVFGSVWTLTTRPFDGDENIVALASDATDLDRRTLVQRAEHLATRLPFAYQAYASAMLQPDYLAVSPLRDAAPPDGYFDLLPPFTGAFSRVDPGLPCPCGSGLRYAACHGAPADTPPSQT